VTQTQEQKKGMYALVGEMIADWNSLEFTLVEMIGQVGRSPDVTNILTAHMSSPAICNALKALAIQRLPADLAEHLVHAVAVFEQLRSYRNNFVHNVTAVIETVEEGAAMTYGRRVTPKGEVHVDQGWLYRSDLETMRRSQTALSGYLTYLRLHVAKHFDADDEPPQAFRYWPPDKLALPPALASRWEPERTTD